MSWTRTSLQNHSTQPHFLGALSPKSHSTKSQPSQNINLCHFFTPWFWKGKKKQKWFCRENPWQPHVRYIFLRIDFPSYSYQKQPLSHLPSFNHFGQVWNIFLSALYHSWGACEVYWHYKMATLQFIETSTFTKWQSKAVWLFSNYTPYKITTTPTPHKSSAHPPKRLNQGLLWGQNGKRCASCRLAYLV